MKGFSINRWFVAQLLSCFILSSHASQNAEPVVTIDSDATVSAERVSIPFSNLASSESRKELIDSAKPKPYGSVLGFHEPSQALDDYRKTKDQHYYKPLLSKQLARFPAEIRSEKIAGVRTDVITPKSGIAERNSQRVLINIHGGSYAEGSAYGARIESIPIAVTLGIKVISVDYSLAPEFVFPLALNQIWAVYSELLKTHRPGQIGVYGCSAGASLTAQLTSKLIQEDRELPGAIGVLCGSLGGPFGEGDAAHISSLLNGRPAPISAWEPIEKSIQRVAYFKGADPRNPVIVPVDYPEILKRFPPTLFTTGTRAHEMSSAAHSHLQLAKQGVESQLYVWDGQGHMFLYNPDLPEAREAYGLIAKFFDQHLE